MTCSEEIRDRLFCLQDKKYKAFQSKLTPTVASETIIGVRTPALRKLARELAKRPDVHYFLDELPHKYYDENNLHGFIISTLKGYIETVRELDRFLPYIDNWATCDLMRPKAFDKNTDRLIGDIRRWISSDHTYTIRFGMEMLMTFYLDEFFSPEYLEMAAEVRSGEYYVNMMLAWFFATALAKQYAAAVSYIEQERLDKWTHNKTIQKAIESFRVSNEQKAYLRTLKRV